MRDPIPERDALVDAYRLLREIARRPSGDLDPQSGESEGEERPADEAA